MTLSLLRHNSSYNSAVKVAAAEEMCLQTDSDGAGVTRCGRLLQG